MNYGRYPQAFPQQPASPGPTPRAMQRSASIGGCGPYGYGGGGGPMNGAGVACNWNQYPVPCQDPVQAAAMLCLQGGQPGYGYGGGPGPDAALVAGNNPAFGNNPGGMMPPGFGFPGGGYFPGYCGIYPQARGPVCTAIGIPETTLTATGTPGSTVNVTINPPNPSQIRCLDIPSDIAASLVFDAFTIGGRPVFYGPIPARIFTEVSEACSKYFTSDTIIPGVGAILTVRNTLNAPVVLRGAIGITELRC